MGMLEDDALSSLRVERMIFHVVGPTEEDLVLMDEIDIKGSESFFLERIKETNIGNRFLFIGKEQGVRPSLVAMNSTPGDFVAISKQLAQSFQNQHETVASKKGAFIVAALSGLDVPTFALIKFDDLRVLRFNRQTGPGGTVKAVVTEIDNTFQEDKKALQKSALIVLNDDGGDVAVFDRTNRANITEYFKAFLGVKRLFTPEQATQRLKRALTTAFDKHAGNAPDGVRTTWRERLYNQTRKSDALDPEDNFDTFGAAIFGEFWSNEEFRSTLSREMDREKISGEAIVLHPPTFKKPTVKELKTFENVLLRYPKELENVNVKIVKNKDGSAVITVNTQRIVDNDLVDDKASR